MHPVGIALAFLVFWSMVAAGGFLLVFCARNLRHLASVSSLRAASAVRAVVNAPLATPPRSRWASSHGPDHEGLPGHGR